MNLMKLNMRRSHSLIWHLSYHHKLILSSSFIYALSLNLFCLTIIANYIMYLVFHLFVSYYLWWTLTLSVAMNVQNINYSTTNKIIFFKSNSLGCWFIVIYSVTVFAGSFSHVLAHVTRSYQKILRAAATVMPHNKTYYCLFKIMTAIICLLDIQCLQIYKISFSICVSTKQRETD